MFVKVSCFLVSAKRKSLVDVQGGKWVVYNVESEVCGIQTCLY